MSLIARVVVLGFGSVLALAMTARGAGPAEALFQLVPPDATATLAIEDLRGHAVEFLESPLAQGFRRLPAFRAWVSSDRYRRFEQALQRIESVLGEKVSRIRDELLGDAVVLTLRSARNGRPEEARGLLLVRVRDRALLDRLIRGVNAAQTRSGELARHTPSNRGGVSYWAREFRPGSRRPTEYYTILGDNTFAWSNAEDLIQGVIDRRAGQERSLAGDPRFQRVRRRLPESAAVSLFMEPVFLARLLESSPRPQRPLGTRASALIGRYLDSLEFAGVALQWRDGLVLHTEEILDPGRLDPWVRQWAARPGEAGPDPRRVPPNALAVGSFHVDFNAVLGALRDLVPGPQQSRLDNLILALNGVLLGRDLQTEVLPQLGPGVLASLEPPDPADRAPDAGLSKVLVIPLGKTTGLAAAVENALRTLLALHALDPRRGEVPLQVESREVNGRIITTLRPTSPFAFAIDGDHLVVGSTAADVARSLVQAAMGTENALVRLREARFPEAGSFACVDLARLHQYILDNRETIVAKLAARRQRPVEDEGDDLDQALGTIALFEQGYITNAIEPDATAVHRAIGLIARPAVPSTPP